MFQEMPCMPSLARVMPGISVFMMFSFQFLFAGCAILGVTVAVILEHLFNDLGLKFSIWPLGDLGQIEILDRIAVGIELEAAAQRGEVGFFQRRRHGVLVAEVTLDRLD